MLLLNEQRLELHPLERRLYRVLEAGEIRHQGIGFVDRVVLPHGHEIDVFGIFKQGDIPHGRAQRVVGRHRQDHRAGCAGDEI